MTVSGVQDKTESEGNIVNILVIQHIMPMDSQKKK